MSNPPARNVFECTSATASSRRAALLSAWTRPTAAPAPIVPPAISLISAPPPAGDERIGAGGEPAKRRVKHAPYPAPPPNPRRAGGRGGWRGGSPPNQGAVAPPTPPG